MAMTNEADSTWIYAFSKTRVLSPAAHCQQHPRPKSCTRGADIQFAKEAKAIQPLHYQGQPLHTRPTPSAKLTQMQHFDYATRHVSRVRADT
jgi:hypothetical protein